jgi:phage baseplate assembly protein W
MANITKIDSTLFSDTWAYDLHKNPLSDGEAYNEEAINISIENILSTSFGERLFNPNFGSVLPLQVFENINKDSGEMILDEIINNIKQWEDRIFILEKKAKLIIKYDENTLILQIPYVIKRSGVSSTFDKKIIF